MSRRLPQTRRDAIAVYRIPFDGHARELPTKEEVGSKAHNLMVMARSGLPVPPGFVLGTGLCRAYQELGADALGALESVLADEMAALGKALGRRFGDVKRPLLVSVRSGAAVSMPGMMETVLNVGLTSRSVQGLIRMTGNPRLAFDCRRRLVAQFGEVVHGVAPDRFETILTEHLASRGLAHVIEIDTESGRELAEGYLSQFADITGEPLSEDPMQQLLATVEAVLKSWSSPRAESYRRLNQISGTIGTAVTVQAMVFGNSGPLSGSGVGFTRNPADGTQAAYIDYLPNAQGEDVVAGRRNAFGASELQCRLPDAYQELMRGCETLERIFGDMQDFEFTIEDGRLYFLQSRAGKRTPIAALRIAHDLVKEKRITKQQALAHLGELEFERIEIEELVLPAGTEPIARAVPAGVGMLAGIAVLDPGRVDELKQRGKPLILIREHAETVDIAALDVADALVTRHGARTSHAAVVARQLGKICLVGCEVLSIDRSRRGCYFGETAIAEGDELSIDGTNGAIYRGAFPVRRSKPDKLIAEIKRWQA